MNEQMDCEIAAGDTNTMNQTILDPRTFLQTAHCLEPLAETGHLWRLPASYRPGKIKNVGPLHLAKISEDSYSKRCNLLVKNWEAESCEDFIPQELLQSTPYSLAALHCLAVLSRKHKRCRREIHSLLLAQVQRRVEQIGQLTDPWVATLTDMENTEYQIKERLDGLMLEDIRNVDDWVKRPSQKVAQAEKAHAELPRQLAQGLQRVAERRLAKLSIQLQLQQELWNGQKDGGGVDLVAVDWARDVPMRGANISTQIASRKPKRHADHEAKQLRMQKTASSGHHQPVCPQRSQEGGQIRATTIPQLVSKLQEENAWKSDTSSEDEGGVSLIEEQEADDFEPATQTKPKAKKKAQKLRSAELSAKLIRSAISDTSRAEHKKEIRQAQSHNKMKHEAWYEGVLAKSVRLPSERMDFSTLGQLEGQAQKQVTDDLMGVLDAMSVGTSSQASARHDLGPPST